jgi:DNA-binding protein, histone-like, putative
MTVKYSVHESPNPKKDEKKVYHARVDSDRVVRTSLLAKEISAFTSFSPGDIKGLLQALSDVLKLHLSAGDSVELDGIGAFSISLMCPKNISDPDKLRASNIFFKKINYKSSIEINRELRGMTFERSRRERKEKNIGKSERHENILKFLKKNSVIQSRQCMAINNCNRYTALKDLKDFVASGKVAKCGMGKTCIYVLLDN